MIGSCRNPKLLKHLDVSKIESGSTKILQSRSNVLCTLPLCYQLYSTEQNLRQFTWLKLTAWMPTWWGTWGKSWVSSGGIISPTKTSWWKLTCPACIKHFFCLYIATSDMGRSSHQARQHSPAKANPQGRTLKCLQAKTLFQRYYQKKPGMERDSARELGQKS